MKRQRTATAVRDPKPEPVSATPTTAPAAPPDPTLEGLAKAQQGLPSAESFWKSAGRFCRLR